MRKYLWVLALLVTGDAFAWSLDAHTPNKPVCDRIDIAPAKPAAKPVVAATPAVAAARDDAAAGSDNSVVTTAPTPTPPRTGGAMGSSHTHNAPRWQSFLPGMFK